MEYFYTPPEHVSSRELIVEGDEFVHLTHVMRRRAGDTIRVVDGKGNAYDAVVERIEKRTAACRITEAYAFLHEPRTRLTLGVALLKNPSKLDFVVEKTTELGVSSIVPLITERTIARQAKVDRWQKLALAAMKQSGRCVLPTVAEVQTLSEFLSSAPDQSVKLLPHEQGTSRMDKQDEEVRDITVCIGPEGGFTEAEVKVAAETGFAVVNLGQRRLRAETAAIATVGRLLANQ